jgi:predicted Zn-dependent protease
VPDQVGAVANLLARYGFATQAERAFKAFVTRRPDEPERVLVLADFFATAGRIPEAMAVLGPAWATLPRELVARAALAVYDSPAAGPAQKRQVRGWVEAVVKERPGETLLKARLADMASEDGNIAEGILGFRQILAKNPDDVGVLNNLAWALALSEEPPIQEALRLIDHAIEVQGSHPSLLDTRAVILIRAGRFDEALRDLQAASEMGTQSPTLPGSLAIHLAWAHQAKGQLAEAREALREAAARGYRLETCNPLERRFIAKLWREVGLAQGHAPSGGE